MNRKNIRLEYKQSVRPMGVFQIRNTVSGKVFIASTLNLDGIFNKSKFQLDAGMHPSKTLQTDWKELGAGNFAFEILEEVFPRENPEYDYAADLEVLENLWLEKFEPYGEKGYNERKKMREERLRMIAANRKL